MCNFPPGLVSSLSDITITVRVRWDGGNDWQRIFDFGNGTGQYMFLTPKQNTAVRFAITNGSGEQILDGPALTVGEWANVAVTLIGNTGTLYVNGVAVATGTITLDPSALAPALNYIGKSQYSTDALFKGAIDDFRIYNRGLSASEISALVIPPAAVSVPDSSYTAWSASYTFPSGQSGADADADRDGVSNTWEYILGSDPLSHSSGVLPTVRVFTAAQLGLGGNKTYLGVQVRVKKRHLGATLIAEAASALEGLTAADARTHARLANAAAADGEYEILTYYYDVAIEDSTTGRGFVRLRVTLN